MAKSERFYRRQIMGLYLIIDDADKKDFMISREYIKEKLRAALEFDKGINFHPTIISALDNMEAREKWEKARKKKK